MTRRLIWIALFALLLSPLLGTVSTVQHARAQEDPTVVTTDGLASEGTPIADESTPEATEEESSTPDASPSDVPTATEDVSDTPTDAASPVASETATPVVTQTPSATPSASPTAKAKVKAAGLPASTDDLSITLKCTGNEEQIKVTYSGSSTVTITQISTLVDQLPAEPFTVSQKLRSSRQTATFSAGAGASHGTVLTSQFIFTDSAYDKDGVSIVTTAGTIVKHCAPKPSPVVSNPGKISDLSITLSCRTNAETIRVTNNGSGYILLKTIATNVDPLPSEPFHVDTLLKPGRTAIYQAGAGAKYGTILTKSYIFTNSAWDNEGVRMSTSVGKAYASCEAKPLPPEHWVEVNLSMQYLWAWEGDKIVNETYVSTGRPGFDTPTGTFYVLVKYLTDDMEGVINGEYYNVPAVPWVQYFTNEGHALHGTYWHNNFGNVMSHGCVNLPLDFAEWLYYWLPYGGRVVIHY
jgi:lipoprotein-anchoring transpeptidase ErfK/SrfK